MEGGETEKSLALGVETLQREWEWEGGKSLAVEIATLHGKVEVETLHGEPEKLKRRNKDAERKLEEARKVVKQIEKEREDMQGELDVERKHLLAAVAGLGKMEKETAAKVKAAEQKAGQSADATNRKWEKEEPEWRKRARLGRSVAVRF